MENNVDAVVELKDLKRIYQMGNRKVEALKGINIKISSGHLVIIKGPSGSGKTTILNMIGALDQPSTGEVILNKKSLKEYSEKELTKLRRENIGFIFQSHGLIQGFTAYENVELPLRISHVSWKNRRERAYECLDMVGLRKRAEHRIFELSGGEQQRVGIARALVNQPDIILADEPTGELDYITTQTIMELFHNLTKKQNVTICMVTHDPEVMKFADIVYEIIDGKIINKERYYEK
ncbi:ABC transporter ATP-binding protein [Natronospora cellulosivora (SeqCode)]